MDASNHFCPHLHAAHGITSIENEKVKKEKEHEPTPHPRRGENVTSRDAAVLSFRLAGRRSPVAAPRSVLFQSSSPHQMKGPTQAGLAQWPPAW